MLSSYKSRRRPRISRPQSLSQRATESWRNHVAHKLTCILTSVSMARRCPSPSTATEGRAGAEPPTLNATDQDVVQRDDQKFNERLGKLKEASAVLQKVCAFPFHGICTEEGP
jgi:hypothetical protein